MEGSYRGAARWDEEILAGEPQDLLAQDLDFDLALSDVVHPGSRG